MLVMIRSVGSKNISFSSLKSNIFLNLYSNNEFFFRGVYIIIYTVKLFSYQQKNVNNEKMI